MLRIRAIRSDLSWRGHFAFPLRVKNEKGCTDARGVGAALSCRQRSGRAPNFRASGVAKSELSRLKAMVHSFFGRVCLGLRFFGTENEGVPRSSIEALRIWIERWTAKRFVVIDAARNDGRIEGQCSRHDAAELLR
jgi:hypothetical protein